ncbi:hypothetical protein Emtol_3159 [Emticicia oligotrophica DSM 17448]|uniref:Beta-propeller repeat protein n=1 Tax=Emticicia oligotrophica (strain DSM 17448 / CIP 109782 / MTCC 6937 / GPTSA100-15) TaxID=929562 RepID=A0ABN4APN9_EMTOG|nr:SBBP repeat-containing protein [Emticicia oligotrophica]AFK04292.1 hypothetical protein Emtol_3159 [Emticicia oligotrophica DSM 17448]
MKKILYVLVCLTLQFGNLKAQNVTITPNGITPAQTSASYLRISYDAILALPSPVKGDMAYDITFDCLRVYNGKKWLCTYQNPKSYVPNSAAIASVSGNSYAYGNKCAVDASGNVYVTGYFSRKANFGSISKTSAGYEDMFVAKYNSEGVVQWVQTAGGNDTDFGYDIAVDASGNVYVTGLFWYTASFGGFSKISSGLGDAFVVKYNSEGVVQWVQTAGGIAGDVSNSVAVDISGNVYITGTYGGTANFNERSITPVGTNDIFVAKYNSSGVIQWVVSAGGAFDDYANAIAVDALGKVYITGGFSGTAYFGSNAETTYGNTDIFVAKFDQSSMNWEWSEKAGGTSGDYGRDIAVDISGNIYITGSIWSFSYFGSITKSIIGYDDAFVAKYDNYGSIQWVQTAGGTGIDDGLSIALDASANVYITGSFFSSATFNGVTQTSIGNFDIFVVKYSKDGAFQWVQSGGSTDVDGGLGIAIDASYNVYLTGYYRGSATFGLTTLTTTNDIPSVFLVRIEK